MPDGQLSAPGTDIENRLVALIPDLERLARRLARDRGDAQDLAQEALARVWAQMAGGGGIEDLRPYLMEAARNIARRPVRRMADLEDVPEPVVAPEVDGRLMLRDAAAALARLSEADRRLVLGAGLMGRSYAELAASEDLPLGTVMSRLARLRARLRAECAAEEPADRAA